MNGALVQKIRQCQTLPSLPTIAVQVLDLAQKEQADISEIAKLISRDPALSSKILKTVNSSFYGRGQSVSTISNALTVLGLQSVKSLVLGFSLVSNLAQHRAKGFKHLSYWRRSVYAATAGRTLATKLGIVQQEEVFLAALLMDIGMLVLDQVLGDSYGEVCATARRHQSLLASESQNLGMNHAEVAWVLAEQWHLPPLLSVPMAMHHDSQAVSDPALRKVAEVVELAGLCADVFAGEEEAEAISAVRRQCQERYRIAEVECDSLLETICEDTREVASLFDINIASSTSYESILKKANETLVELTLRMQQQTATLQQENLKLQAQATIDVLTGLVNRRTLDRALAERFASARRVHTPLAVLLLDLDKFKTINDQHGHPVGDQVLRWVGRVLRSAARAGDLAARYGGEEMMLVMPGTTKDTACAMAECVRRAIAARPIACGNSVVPITISIGVAVMDQTVPFTQPAHLIKAADLALYAAKHGGRNCVKVFSLRPGAQPAAA